MNTETVLRIRGLTKLDEHELTEIMGEELEFEPMEESGVQGEAYEPGLIVAAIVISVVAIKALAAWMLKKRGHGELSYEFEVTSPDGTVTVRRFRYKTTSSTSEADVVEAIGKALGLDESMIKLMAAPPTTS